MTATYYRQTVSTVLTFEQRPCIIGRVAALCGGFLVYCDSYIFCSILRLLVHARTVRIVRIGYPCVIGLSIRSGCTGNTLLTLYLTPCVVGRGVALHRTRLVVGESDIRFPCRIIADTSALCVVGVSYPCIVSNTVLSRRSGNTLRTCRSVRSFVHLFQPCRVII